MSMRNLYFLLERQSAKAVLYLVLALSLSAHGPAPSEKRSLKLQILDLKDVPQSTLHIELLDASGVVFETRSIALAPHSTRQTFSIQEVEQEEIAIRLFQDLDGDGELDKNAFGLPTEPFGFSNDPVIRFGPPSTQEILIDLRTKTFTKIRMQ
jgi:uncharacterized protein (DUF2141 family)